MKSGIQGRSYLGLVSMYCAYEIYPFTLNTSLSDTLGCSLSRSDFLGQKTICSHFLHAGGTGLLNLVCLFCVGLACSLRPQFGILKNLLTF